MRKLHLIYNKIFQWLYFSHRSVETQRQSSSKQNNKKTYPRRSTSSTTKKINYAENSFVDISDDGNDETKSSDEDSNTSVSDNSDENDDLLDISAIEPVVVVEPVKRKKLRRVQLLSDSSSDEDETDGKLNTTLHCDEDESQKGDNKLCLSTKKPAKNSQHANSSTTQLSDRPVRKYKFRRIQSTTSSITKPMQQLQSHTKTDKKGNRSTSFNTAGKIKIYKDESPKSNLQNSSSNGGDCLVETVLTTPHSKPSVDSILEKDLSFSIDGFDQSLFNDEISPCVLSQQSTRGKMNKPWSGETTPKPTQNTSKQATPTKTNRDTNMTIDTSPLSPFGMSDRRYNFKTFRRTFKHYNPVGKKVLKNLENISMDSDIIWPTP